LKDQSQNTVLSLSLKTQHSYKAHFKALCQSTVSKLGITA